LLLPLPAEQDTVFWVAKVRTKAESTTAYKEYLPAFPNGKQSQESRELLELLAPATPRPREAASSLIFTGQCKQPIRAGSTDITDMYRIFSVIHGKIEEISKLIYRKKIRIPGIKVKEVGGNFGLCSGIYGWIWVDSYGKAVLGGRLRKG